MEFIFDHIVINVVDIDKMVKFYTEVLQLPGERLEEFTAGQVPFPSVRLSADSIIDLFPKKMWEKTNPEEVCRPNLNHFCFATDEAGSKALQASSMSKALLLRKGQSSAGEHMGLARQFILGTRKGIRLKSAITLMGKGLYLVSLTPEKPGLFS